jgi:hypothetical protein
MLSNIDEYLSQKCVIFAKTRLFVVIGAKMQLALSFCTLNISKNDSL